MKTAQRHLVKNLVKGPARDQDRDEAFVMSSRPAATLDVTYLRGNRLVKNDASHRWYVKAFLGNARGHEDVVISSLNASRAFSWSCCLSPGSNGDFVACPTKR